MQDTGRLEALMNQHGNAILRFCTLQLRDAKLAEDAAQDVFVKAWFFHLSQGEEWTDMDGVYVVTVNMETGAVEEIFYDSGLAGNG